MSELLLVAAGGAVGAVARWLLGGFVQRQLGPGFPLGTLTVNVLGSLAMGLVLTLASERAGFSPGARLAIATGGLGAFTTFSTFSWETVELLRDGAWGAALTNVGVSVAVCLLACWGGVLLGRTLA